MDRDLVEAAQRGDQGAFMDLVRSRGDRLFSIAHRILRDVDRAEDALQDTLVIAWRDLPSLRDPDRFDAWVHRVLTNVCIAQATRERRRATNLRVLPMEGPPVVDELIGVADRDQLDRGFRRLTPDERAVLVLYHYVGCASSEIAELLGIPAGTVRSRLHHAHRAMRAALDAEIPRLDRRRLLMNEHSEIERLMVAWFDDGPTVMPDRVATVVADRIGHTRQRGRWRLERRLLDMNPFLKVGAALAAVVLIAVIGYNLLPARQGIGVPGPTASPTPTPSPLALPDGLLESRDYVGRALTGDPMTFIITAPKGWTGYGGFFIGGPQLSGPPSGIGISFNHDPQVVDDPCSQPVVSPSPALSAPSIDELVAALSARDDLQVSGVTDTVLAGYSGKRLDLQLPATLACDNHYVFAEPKGLYANGPANRWRVWLLDVKGDTAVVVLLDYATTPIEDRTAAQAAIDSIRITP